ncbi:Uncharacterized protein QTN25_005919 [Entamoeba marina]
MKNVLLLVAILLVCVWIPLVVLSYHSLPKFKEQFTAQKRLQHIDLPHFVYDGVCSSLFTHNKSSSRDLIMFSHSHGDSWDQQKYEIEQTLTLLRTTLPTVTVVIITINELPTEFREMMNKFNVTIISAPIEYNEWNCVNARIPLSYMYLSEHPKDYDRVIWSDLRDVYYFSDIFRTFGKDDLYWLTECTGIECYTFYNRYPHFSWTLQFFGKLNLKQYIESDAIGINGGLGMGGYHKMLKVLEIWNDNFDFSYKNSWGYDQTLLNKLYYDGLFDSVGLSLEKCTQRMCFKPSQLFINFVDDIAVYQYGCSPIVLHKGLPGHWRSLNGSVQVKEEY